MKSFFEAPIINPAATNIVVKAKVSVQEVTQLNSPLEPYTDFFAWHTKWFSHLDFEFYVFLQHVVDVYTLTAVFFLIAFQIRFWSNIFSTFYLWLKSHFFKV